MLSSHRHRCLSVCCHCSASVTVCHSGKSKAFPNICVLFIYRFDTSKILFQSIHICIYLILALIYIWIWLCAPSDTDRLNECRMVDTALWFVIRNLCWRFHFFKSIELMGFVLIRQIRSFAIDLRFKFSSVGGGGSPEGWIMVVA